MAEMEDGWTTVTSGKRSRSAKNLPLQPPLKKHKHQLENEEEEDDLCLNIIEDKLEFELKKVIKKKQKNPQRSLCPEGISNSDLQNFIFWIYNIGINPNWIFVKNRILLDKCVVIAIGGFTEQVYNENISNLSNINRIFKKNKIVTVAPGSDTAVYSPLKSFLYLPNKKKKKTQTKETVTILPPKDYVHTLYTLVNNGYPLRIKDINKNNDDTTVEYEKLPDYVTYNTVNDNIPSTQELIAIDCEMCLTKNGSELTRVTAVDMNNEILYDQLVKPSNPILDYLTRYSGITKELLDPVVTTLEEVQEHLKELIFKNTILVGHSLENDLHALKISHFNVIDTALLFPHQNGLPSKLSLKALVQTYLHRVIQTGCHDSAQDAIAAMDLTKLKISKGQTFGVPQNNGISIFENLKKHNILSTMIDRGNIISNHYPDGIICESDDDAVSNISNTILNNSNNIKFIYSQWHSLMNYYKLEEKQKNEEKQEENNDSETTEEQVKQEDVLKRIDNAVLEIYNNLPKNSFLILTTGQSNLITISKLWKLKRENTQDWTEKHATILRNEIIKVRKGITLFTTKS